MNQLTLRAALALYPGRYRRERGEELAAVFADTTADAGRLATARELLDLGAYGLRLRTGLTSTSAGGRLAALTSPLAAGAVAGLAAVAMVADYSAYQAPHSARVLLILLAFWVLNGSAVLSAGAVLLGRWTAARLLAGMTALAVVADLLLQVTTPTWQFLGGGLWELLYDFQWDGPFLLWALVLVAAPRDALPTPTWWQRGMVVASAALSPFLVLETSFYRSWHHLDLPWRAAMVCIPLLMALTALRGWYVVAVPGLAALAWTLSINLNAIWQQTGGMWRLLPMAALTVTAMVGLVMLRRPSGSAGAGGGDGRLTA
ncbi:hypothetical protein F7Q99_11195 [Streptomyces kaniharaensis]|uniref:Uncharacterized protein n=1 Tax=Streptomyces kaniharaensis TaxID=212423 RepID=A0A6N7KTB9_9ACTN|nr:hypothetical protein [Streptomyces kaniharaensis]MQS12843.1 hypothetical protein [Streptomyces kaniharaensis]